MGYCYVCGVVHNDVKCEHIRLDLCKGHMKLLKTSLIYFTPIHDSLSETKKKEKTK